MPLRFRSVVPYALPGVLALMGWWWYFSRKKQRLIGLDGPEGATPTAVGLKTSPAEGSNGLFEKGTVSPTHDSESPTQVPPAVTDHRGEDGNISQNAEVAFLLEQSSAEAAPGKTRGEEILLKEDSLQVDDHTDPDPDQCSSPGLELEIKDADTIEEVIVACQSAKVSSSSPTTAHLSDAERPDPEGEVAKHCSSIPSEDKMVICAVTTAEVQMVIPSEADSLKTPPSVKEFHQHVLTSTPNFPAPATVQEHPTRSETAEDMQLCGGEEQNLELLASGLITEVISAATQEVLGVTSCQVTDNGQPDCSSMALGSGQLCPQSDPVTATQHHLLLNGSQIGHHSRKAAETEEPGMPNGCPMLDYRVHQTDCAQRDHWATASHQAAQSPPPLEAQLKGGEVVALAEDSACSTCHSDDGISSEELQNSTFAIQADSIQVTDCSAREATQSLDEMATDATVSGETEENSLDAVCDIKKLNGLSLRNGALGASEVETDQSGGSDVNSMDSVDSGCTMGAGESQANRTASSSSELIVWEIEVPKHLVGRLIGKQGRYVSFLKQNSGAKIYISTLPYTEEFQICHIEGTQQQVDKALSLIGKKFKDLDLTNLYAPPPPPLTLPSLPMTSWLLLPSGVTVEVIVVNIVSAGHVFVQQHTHPTYHALRSLDQQMFLCYSQPGTPALPSPAEVGVICAAPAGEGAWWRAQVITFYKDANEVEIRYVDYGGYDRVKIDSLRQIRSDFVTLPFQGAEVLLDNIAPLPGEDRFSTEATTALEEMTRGVALLAQVSNYDNNTGLPLVHLWNMVGDEVMLVNRALVERGLGVWVDGF